MLSEDDLLDYFDDLLEKFNPFKPSQPTKNVNNKQHCSYLGLIVIGRYPLASDFLTNRILDQQTKSVAG